MIHNPMMKITEQVENLMIRRDNNPLLTMRVTMQKKMATKTDMKKE